MRDLTVPWSIDRVPLLLAEVRFIRILWNLFARGQLKRSSIPRMNFKKCDLPTLSPPWTQRFLWFSPHFAAWILNSHQFFLWVLAPWGGSFTKLCRKFCGYKELEKELTSSLSFSNAARGTITDCKWQAYHWDQG